MNAVEAMTDRVEVELAQLFRSRKFSQSIGQASRTKLAHMRRAQDESVNNAVMYEEFLNTLAKEFSQHTNQFNKDWDQLESKYCISQRENAEHDKTHEVKEATEQARSEPMQSVKEFIAWFRAAAPNRARKPKERAEELPKPHAASLRTPILTSQLPSPHEQAMQLIRANRVSTPRSIRELGSASVSTPQRAAASLLVGKSVSVSGSVSPQNPWILTRVDRAK